MAEIFVEDGSVEILNETDVDTSAVMAALGGKLEAEIASITRWHADVRRRRDGGLFDRDKYLNPEGIFEQFKVARKAAAEDDIVSGVIEATEALAFAKMSIECENEEEEDFWNQLAAELDVDSRLREQWRELVTLSQFYCAVWWKTKEYKVRGRTAGGNKKRKVFNRLAVPAGVTLLDPLKIVPVGNMWFNREQLAYIADFGETDIIDRVIRGEAQDPMFKQLIVGPYTPTSSERQEFGELGIAADNLYLLNSENVFRHTETRSQYERFAKVRMMAVSELLDLKHQLRAMERAHLIGGTNFIVLIRRGTDQLPASPGEVQQLRTQVRTLSRLPVLVGDHRLSVDIVTPATDKTLDPARHNGIDARIAARLYQMFMTGNFSAGARGDDSIKLARVVARGLESRRHMMRRTWERRILLPTFERNPELTSLPKLRFHPKRVALDLDPAYVNFILDLRDRGDLSRETILEEADFSQSTEARRRQLEKDRYDDIFETVVPGAPAPTSTPSDSRRAGRRGGGTKNGGGAAPGTGQGQEPRDPRNKSDDD